MKSQDYTSYTFRQLYEGLESVRGDLYPEALSALEAEISRRHDVPKAELEEVYFHLDHGKYPEHRKHLTALILQQGGFDTIAAEVVTETNRYQTGWRRFWALVFDSLLLQLLIGVSTIPVIKHFANDVVIVTGLTVVSQTVILLYFILMHATLGQTLGKMLTGVKIVRYPDEHRIGLTQALLRETVPLLLLAAAIVMLPYSDIIVSTDKGAALKPPGIVTGVALLALLWGLLEVLTMLFSKKRRALHDLIARTVVVRYLKPRPVKVQSKADGKSLGWQRP